MKIFSIFRKKYKEVITEQFNNLETEIWMLEEATTKHKLCEDELLARLNTIKNSLNVIQQLQK